MPPPKTDLGPEVFISYRRRETGDAARHLDHLLSAQEGFGVFLDRRRLVGGDDWWERIDGAIRSPQLAVGIVLMAADWFTTIAADQRWRANLHRDAKPDLVMWEEIRGLRREAARPASPDAGPVPVLMPVVVRKTGDTNEPPALPDPGTPGYPQLEELHRYLVGKHFRFVDPDARCPWDDLLDDVRRVVRRSVAGRPIDPALGIPAERTPPQPLHRMAASRPLRRRFVDYAEIAATLRTDHVPDTILGQEAVLDRQYGPAIERLDSARRKAPPLPSATFRRGALPEARERPTSGDPRTGGDAPAEVLRTALWQAQALNLLVLASFDGERPRRRPITEAGRLLARLVDAVSILVGPLRRWPRGETDQDRADRASTAYVMGTNLLLLWLLWLDFFVARNVHHADAAVAGSPEFEQALRTVATDLDEIRRRRRPDEPDPFTSVFDDSLRGLTDSNHLTDLPAELRPQAFRAWYDGWCQAWRSGRPAMFLSRWPV